MTDPLKSRRSLPQLSYLLFLRVRNLHCFCSSERNNRKRCICRLWTQCSHDGRARHTDCGRIRDSECVDCALWRMQMMTVVDNAFSGNVRSAHRTSAFTNVAYSIYSEFIESRRYISETFLMLLLRCAGNLTCRDLYANAKQRRDSCIICTL